MIDIPADYYINQSVTIGAVLKMTANELIDTDVPHYFIVVAIAEEDLFMLLCTTQREKKEAYFSKNDYSLTSLVCIKNDSENGLTEESYVNCHDYYTISRTDLIYKKENGELNYVGEISHNHYDQLRTGIKASYINDLPHDLLIHPKD